MAPTRKEIKEWLLEGKKEGATHVIIVCDQFDYEDYPVKVMPDEDVHEKCKEYNNYEKMSKVMEVYNLKKNIEEQLKERRSFNY